MKEFFELLETYQWYAPLMQLLGIMILGYLLGIIPCIVTQTIKAKAAENQWIKDHSWIILIFAILLSGFMGLGFKWAFATEMTYIYAAWLGFFLWLGSWDFYRKLKESDSTFGKIFKSAADYIESNITTENTKDIIQAAIKEAAQVEESKK
jgi:hypothetical protein